MNNWPASSLYQPEPHPVEVAGGLLFSPWLRGEALNAADRVRKNGLTAAVSTFPGDRGIFVSICSIEEKCDG